MVLAVFSGGQAAVFAEALARTQGAAWWRAVAALGLLGIAMALLHVSTYGRSGADKASPR